jgi:hypothetical protein
MWFLSADSRLADVPLNLILDVRAIELHCPHMAPATNEAQLPVCDSP